MRAEPLASDRSGHGPRLVLVHGFTQTRRSWRHLAAALSSDHEVVAVDAPGHGDSRHDDADLVTGARLLATAGGTGTYVGYSMGGRLSMHVAIHQASVVERLVLIGATAGIDDPAARAERRHADQQRARRLERIGLDAFLDEWLALPLFSGLDDGAADVADRRRNRVAGLAGSLRHAGTGTQHPLWDQLPGIDCPVLLLVGERDVSFRAHAERMAGLLPDVTLEVIGSAGHTAHLEQPERTGEALHGWLTDHPPMARPTEATTP